MRRVISCKNLPMRPPIIATIVWYLFLERVNAPEWLWGLMGALLGIFWIVCIWGVNDQKQIELEELKGK